MLSAQLRGTRCYVALRTARTGPLFCLSAREAQNLCAAHTATLMARKNKGASIHARMLKALDKVSRTLKAHEGKYG